MYGFDFCLEKNPLKSNLILVFSRLYPTKSFLMVKVSMFLRFSQGRAPHPHPNQSKGEIEHMQFQNLHVRVWKYKKILVWVGTSMTVFVGQEMVNFPAPQKPDPKISQRALNPDMFPKKGLNASLLEPIPPSC